MTDSEPLPGFTTPPRIKAVSVLFRDAVAMVDRKSLSRAQAADQNWHRGKLPVSAYMAGARFQPISGDDGRNQAAPTLKAVTSF